MLLRSFKQVGGASRFRLGLTASAAGVLAVTLSLILVPTAAHAATDPVLGDANSFAVLSSTYTNTATGTTMTGDLGYTTPPAVAATVNGNTYQPPSGYYTQAGIDQGTALANLNGQACTFTFGAGAVDLATDTTHGALGIYLPGVYCTDTLVSSAASIGTAGITLTGAGTYIFKVNGALTSLTTSSVRLAGGASSCDVWWDPIGATTLGSPLHVRWDGHRCIGDHSRRRRPMDRSSTRVRRHGYDGDGHHLERQLLHTSRSAPRSDNLLCRDITTCGFHVRTGCDLHGIRDRDEPDGNGVVRRRRDDAWFVGTDRWSGHVDERDACGGDSLDLGVLRG